MFDPIDEAPLQPALPAKKRQILPYLILACLFAVGLIIYLCIPVKPQ